MRRTSVTIPATKNWRRGRSLKRMPKVGKRIHHDIFGAGTAVPNEYSSYLGDISIKFDVHGLKIMMWSFASLNGRIKTLLPRKPRTTTAPGEAK